MLTPKPFARIFLESLDPVRFALAEEQAERLIHVRLEILLALLFGRQIVLSEPVAVDSLGFLRIAQDVIAARNEASLITSVKPFVLAIRSYRLGHQTFQDMAATLIGSGKFVLSGWPEIANDERSRLLLAKQIRHRDFNAAAGTFPSLSDNIEALASISEYFDGEHVITSRIPKASISDYLITFERSLSILPKSATNELPTLKRAFHDLRVAGIALEDRSAIRKYGEQFLPSDVNRVLTSLSDLFYNIVVAESVHAESAVVSLSGLSQRTSLLWNYKSAITNMGLPNRDQSGEISIRIERSSEAKALEFHFPAWRKVIHLLGSPEWLNSIRNLSRSASMSGLSGTELLEKSFAHHVTLIREALEDDRFRLSRRGFQLIIAGGKSPTATEVSAFPIQCRVDFGRWSRSDGLELSSSASGPDRAWFSHSIEKQLES